MKKFSIWMILWTILLVLSIMSLVRDADTLNKMKPMYDNLKKNGYDLKNADTAPRYIITLSDGSESTEPTYSSTREIATAYANYTGIAILIMKDAIVVFFILVILFILYRKSS